jgi:orotate phosphoribosyltransferase
MLLEVKAVQFRPSPPFIFTSGWASPVYIDCRKLISYPRVRQTLIDFATATILSEIGFEALDGVAGGETAGIPFAAWIADRLMLPMQYIRKKPKGFGRNAQIEGDLRPGARTLLVEDLTTDARSKVNFCNALREAGAVVEHAFVVFHYGVFPTSLRTMAEIGVTLHALVTWWDVFRQAKEDGVFDTETLAEVERFLNDPMGWSAAHGGVAAVPG